LYHRSGYPAVLVNIPEQTLEGGIVKFEVIEARIGRVKVTGNRYFSTDGILKELGSLNSGKILYQPTLQREIARLKRNPDFEISPTMSAGQVLGTIDVELKVVDKLPLHGHFELNNRASHNTTQLRANGLIRYENLWQKEHSFSFQYQTAPQKTSDVQLFTTTYSFPSPWNIDNQLTLYNLYSDTDVGFGEGFKVKGKGKIFGLRYGVPLPTYNLYAHNVTLGIDFKDFNQATGFTLEKDGTTETTETPITYLPISLSYSSSLADGWGGTTQFSGGLNLSLRGFGSKESEFELKRYKGKSNYLFATAGIQRTQKLFSGLNISMSLDGQTADRPLIDSEQYSAGGMESVRGYMESEASGDNAVHGTAEVLFPDPLEKFGIGKWFWMTPYFFYDAAELTRKDPLPGEDTLTKIEGMGGGIRGLIAKVVEYDVHLATPLKTTDSTESGDWQCIFKIKGSF
jgi:hemolysin activation/secretion protein